MSKAKAKGTAFETLVLETAKLYYPEAIRSPLAGSKDVGDLYLPGELRFIAEAKHHARLELAGWAREAEREAMNAGKPYWVIVHKRVGKGKGSEQWATLTWGNFLALANRNTSPSTGPAPSALDTGGSS